MFRVAYVQAVVPDKQEPPAISPPLVTRNVHVQKMNMYQAGFVQRVHLEANVQSEMIQPEMTRHAHVPKILRYLVEYALHVNPLPRNPQETILRRGIPSVYVKKTPK